MDPMTGALLGGVIGGAGNAYMNWLNNKHADQRQEKSEYFDAYMYQNRYQMTVADLKAAGLNPMLAYGLGAGSVPGSGVASAASAGDPGSSGVEAFNATRMASAQEANVVADTQKKRQETMTSAAQEKNIESQTLINAEIPAKIAGEITLAAQNAQQTAAMVDKIRAEIGTIGTQVKEMESRIAKNKADKAASEALVSYYDYMNMLHVAETFLTNAQSRHTGLQGDILDPKAKAAKHPTAEAAARAENFGAFGRAAWDFLGGGYRGPGYGGYIPKRAGD